MAGDKECPAEDVRAKNKAHEGNQFQANEFVSAIRESAEANEISGGCPDLWFLHLALVPAKPPKAKMSDSAEANEMSGG